MQRARHATGGQHMSHRDGKRRQCECDQQDAEGNAQIGSAIGSKPEVQNVSASQSAGRSSGMIKNCNSAIQCMQQSGQLVFLAACVQSGSVWKRERGDCDDGCKGLVGQIGAECIGTCNRG